VALPSDALAGLLGSNTVLASLGALVVAVPLYVCATGSVPIAASLVAAGFPVGAALVFLMAGPATNIATLGAVRRAFGLRTVVLYLTVIVLGSLGFAVVGEAVLGDLLARHADHLHHGHGGSPGLLEQVVAIALVAAVVGGELLSFARAMRRRLIRRAGPDRTFHVDGLTCGSCVAQAEGALKTVPGVATAAVDLATGAARVTFAPSDRQRGRQGAFDAALSAALTPRGFEARGFRPDGPATGGAGCGEAACGGHAHGHG
jgi:copper chaperone CopZ